MKYDAVLSYHLNEFSCGVARFNKQLAKRLGVPCLSIHTTESSSPLISIKTSEIEQNRWFYHMPLFSQYDLLLHDRPTNGQEALATAGRVFYADEIGCPSTLEGNPHRGVLNVLLFGMSHKIDVHTVYVGRLRDLLEKAHADYTVSVSTAVHEGTPWDHAFTKTVENLRKEFGNHLRVLGYLADDALAKELKDSTACALFFDPAARSNNTTLWGALAAGCPVVTNLDADSPPELVHHQTVFDIAQMTDWPFWHLLRDVASRGQVVGKARSWEKLIERLNV